MPGLAPLCRCGSSGLPEYRKTARYRTGARSVRLRDRRRRRSTADWLRPRRGGGPASAWLDLLLSSDLTNQSGMTSRAGVGFTPGPCPGARIIVVAFTDYIGSSQPPIRRLL